MRWNANRSTWGAASYPRAVLAFAIFVIAGVAVVAAIAVSVHRGEQDIAAESLRMERLIGTITHLDEVLTMSARMTAASGDQTWEARHDRHVDRLNDAIVEARAIEQGLFGDSVLAETDAANSVLVDMESRAFGLVAQGRHTAAERLLSGDVYNRNKRAYASGLMQLSARLRDSHEARLRDQRALLWRWITLGAVGLVLALAVWVVIAARLGRWHSTLVERTAQRDALVRDRADQQFVALTRSSSDISAIVDVDGTIRYQSDAVLRVLGHEPSALLGTNVADLVHPDDRDLLSTAYQQLAVDDAETALDVRVRHADGQWRHTETTIRNLRGDPDIEGFVVNTRDVTDRVVALREAEEHRNRTLTTLEGAQRKTAALQRSEQFLRQIVTSAPLVLYAADATGRFLFSEGSALSAIGRQPGEVVGESIFELYGDDSDIAAHVRAALSGETLNARVVTGGTAFECAFGPLSDDEGAIVGMIGVSTDVTAQAELELQLEHEAHHDGLTGLLNRNGFHNRMTAIANSDEPVHLLMVDVDDFKGINDAHGPAVGDQVLIAVAQRLRAIVRGEDVVARLAGDEFAVVLWSVSPDDLDATIVRLAEHLAEPLRVVDADVSVTTSIGVMTTMAADLDVQRLLRDADLAMYTAKDAGGDRHVYFEPSLRTQQLERVTLRADLSRAIAQRQFVVEYQPTLALRDRRIVGFEALVRWEHPTRGLVPPIEFIPLAEETGQIHAIGMQVLRDACAQAHGWRQQYPVHPPLWMAVNLSARQLSEPTLVDDVEDVLLATGLPASALVLELTETAVMERVDEVGSVLAALRGLGIRLALDDFGTGYSSLSQLQRLPVDVLKIDRSFVTGLDSSTDPSLARTIVELGQQLELELVAEGIEQDTEYEVLRTLGCDHGQGYLLARPLRPGACRSLLDSEFGHRHDTTVSDSAPKDITAV